MASGDPTNLKHRANRAIRAIAPFPSHTHEDHAGFRCEEVGDPVQFGRIRRDALTKFLIDGCEGVSMNNAVIFDVAMLLRFQYRIFKSARASTILICGKLCRDVCTEDHVMHDMLGADNMLFTCILLKEGCLGFFSQRYPQVIDDENGRPTSSSFLVKAFGAS